MGFCFTKQLIWWSSDSKLNPPVVENNQTPQFRPNGCFLLRTLDSSLSTQSLGLKKRSVLIFRRVFEVHMCSLLLSIMIASASILWDSGFCQALVSLKAHGRGQIRRQKTGQPSPVSARYLLLWNSRSGQRPWWLIGGLSYYMLVHHLEVGGGSLNN